MTILVALAVSVLPVLAHGVPGGPEPFGPELTAEGPTEGPSTVTESARRIPVVHDVDVVVVGGSTGAVSAAVAAARQGASVFLAAPRTYLGDDMCGTLRLWIEPHELPALAGTPLEAAARLETPRGPSPANRAPFTYQADRPSAARHRDTDRPSLLTDGRWHSDSRQSVQYDGDVTLTLDLGQPRAIRRVHIFVYQRPGDFEVAGATLSVSDDRERWQRAGVIENDRLDKGAFERAFDLSAAVAAMARFVRVAVRKTPASTRILLGEIIVETESAADQAGAGAPEPRVFTPMEVKRALDEALLAAGVRFLFGCYATDVLRDAEGRPAGIVMANRAGRQAVLAKVIIDATDRAVVARLAGADFTPCPEGPQVFTRIGVGGEMREGDGFTGRKLAFSFASAKRAYPAFEYTLHIPMADGQWAAFAGAEQIARDRTFHPHQVDASEVLFQVPPCPMKGQVRVEGPWPGPDEVDMGAFRPAGAERMFVLGGCADVPRAAAADLLRPTALMAVGARVGAAAAAEAKATARPQGVHAAGPRPDAAAAGDVRELLRGARPTQHDLPAVPSGARAVPVLGRYDVVVVGGGTGGAPAAIAAARQGARTLVIEYLHGLGGVSTLGLIGTYYHGYRGGFTREIDAGVRAVGAAVGVVGKMEYYRREIRRAGGEIWFTTLGCGAVVQDGQVKGVVVATPEGRGVVLAGVVIDSTGNADIAAAAGATCQGIGETDLGLQGTGLPPREPGASYTNTDYAFVDDADAVDTWHLFVYARRKFTNAYDLGQLIDSRERRRIVGDFVLTPLDQLNRRTYPDTIAQARSDFDSHGFTVHPIFALNPPGRASLVTHVPYRCLLPKGLDGILVTGLGVSAHRDAVPLIRMQPDIQNQGYAAGVAAAMAAKRGTGTRSIDLHVLQKHLVEVGCLPESVLADTDSYPLPAEQVAQAVRTAGKGYQGLPVILAQPEEALPLLRAAYAAADGPEEKLAYAHVLGVLGDATGVEALVAKVESTPWDQPWSFKGMGQYGASLSPLDRTIVALGFARDRRALEPILEKVRSLDAKGLSHHRAVALALEALRAPEAAQPLADLLRKPGMSGHAITPDFAPAGRPAAGREDRNNALRELVLARALFRCGDYEGLAERILRQYEKDPTGLYARHAHAVLQHEGRRSP